MPASQPLQLYMITIAGDHPIMRQNPALGHLVVAAETRQRATGYANEQRIGTVEIQSCVFVGFSAGIVSPGVQAWGE